MGFEQINTADFDYEMMLATINAAYIGKAEITLSNYDNDSEPVIKVGAKIEVNGALIKLTTDDATPTGYAAITNSTTFYLYYDESAGVAIYSETSPTWNDALQGWYNSNDRAFFSMFKDSGGTLYENKSKLSTIMRLQPKIISTGSWVVASGQTKIIPIGDYHIRLHIGTSIYSYAEVFINGSWRTILWGQTVGGIPTNYGGFIRSDGENARIFSIGSNTTTHYNRY